MIPLWIFLVGVTLMPVLTAASSLDLGSDLKVNVVTAKNGGELHSFRLAINLWNQNLEFPLTHLEIKVGVGKAFHIVQNVPYLEARQSLAIMSDLQDIAGNPYLIISYYGNGKRHSLARNIEMPYLPQTSHWPSVIPAIISLVSSAVGGWLTHLFTTRRERRRTEFDWGKMIFERYEKGYLSFLNGWRGFPNADILRREFQALQATCFVPTRIATIYEETINLLSDTNASDIQKADACKSLRDAIDQFITKPWSLSREVQFT